jgi:glucose-1-phosphate adenylyltransferase
MLQNHIKNAADLSVSVIQVDWEEASRFGIITANEDGRITKFTEKPKEPDSNLASMGIYIFSIDILKDALIEDSQDEESEHDFGKNVIPKLLAADKRLYCYEFSGFWKDVGTIPSYHETSMGLLDPNPAFDLFDPSLPPIMSNSNIYPPQYLGANAKVSTSMVANASCVLGTVNHSILSTECYVGEGAYVEDSVLLPGARVEAGAKVVRAILGEEAVVAENVEFGSSDPDVEIAVLGNGVTASLPEAKGGNVNG